MASRWWVYQRERFPVLAHGLLIAAFSSSAVCFSVLARGGGDRPLPLSLLTAFATAFLFFFQLRVADEHKDHEEDTRYRPYRPVPRGLISLRELALAGVAGGVIQLALALWLDPRLVALLAVIWLYLALMSKEFFVAEWLRHRPVLYMASHMVIVPLIDFYATACDWLPRDLRAPRGVVWFVLVSYANGIVIEVGRKIRTPRDEEEGVSTYSVLWGPRGAVLVWLGAMTATAALAARAAALIGFLVPVVVLLLTLLCLAAATAARFLATHDGRLAKRLEAVSGIWTLFLYLSLGVIPLLWTWAAHTP